MPRIPLPLLINCYEIAMTKLSSHRILHLISPVGRSRALSRPLTLPSILSLNPSRLISKFPSATGSIVWTKAMKRLYSLVAISIKYNEPVLLVGETGCCKTGVCQTIAEQMSQHLHLLNVHQNSETSDFLGSQRPSRHQDDLAALIQEFRAVLSLDGEESG